MVEAEPEIAEEFLAKPRSKEHISEERVKAQPHVTGGEGQTGCHVQRELLHFVRPCSSRYSVVSVPSR